MIPIQLCFNIYYDDEIEIALEKYHLNHSLTSFLVLVPEIMLIIDTLLKFITGYYENGVIVENKSKIVHHYLSKGLFTDCLTYIPTILQGFLRKQFPWIGLIVKELQILMFLKIKRVKVAMTNYEEIIATNGKNDFLLSFLKLMYVILFITHLNACLWHAVAFYNPEMETWLDYSQLKEAFWLKRYLYSFYWAISMMGTIGFGEKVSPRNNMECFVGIFIVITSIMGFGYCINSMKQILDLWSKEEQEYKYSFKCLFNII